jgi:hypothetical protein
MGLHVSTTMLQPGVPRNTGHPRVHDRISSRPRACRGGEAGAAESEHSMQGYVAAHVAACPTPRPRGAPSPAGLWLCATWEVGAPFCVADLLARQVVWRWPRRSPASEVVAGRACWTCMGADDNASDFSRCSSSVSSAYQKYLQIAVAVQQPNAFPTSI